MKTVELKRKYRLPVYRKWDDVPEHLHTRTSALRIKIVIPKDAQPDAIKNAASVLNKDLIYFLYDIRKLTP